MNTLQTNRSLTKYILLGLITLGIYDIVVMTKISNDINTIASKYDGKHTMNFCLVAFLFSWLTFGIVPLVWYHRLSSRIGVEQARRNQPVTMTAGTFWGWYFLGSLIIVGPFVYAYRLLHSMNALSEDYNKVG